jgi:hypothetical protein
MLYVRSWFLKLQPRFVIIILMVSSFVLFVNMAPVGCTVVVLIGHWFQAISITSIRRQSILPNQVVVREERVRKVGLWLLRLWIIKIADVIKQHIILWILLATCSSVL